MRKMKKINGFLVVRFNDREKRVYPDLGSFGVIDAEQYVGDIDLDLGEMEYTDAETMEIAVEQARGLNAEVDYGEKPTTYAVITETATTSREEEVAPKAMALSYEEQLKTQIKSKHYPDIDPRTAAHELNGYKTALHHLGLLEADDAITEPDAFGEACQLYTDEGHRVDIMLPSKAGLAVLSPHDYEEGETFTGCTVQTLKCRRCGRESFAWSKGPGPEQEEAQAKETFTNLPSGMRSDRNTRKVYALGLALAEECPDNDCRVYLNIFNAARELDEALDTVKPNSAPFLALRSALVQYAGELWQMYAENYAVQQYKKGMGS